MRSLEAILNDPQALPEELDWLADRHPQQAVQHANCPMLVWFRLAERYPMSALQCPSAPLFLLEDPARWAQVPHHILQNPYTMVDAAMEEQMAFLESIDPWFLLEYWPCPKERWLPLAKTNIQEAVRRIGNNPMAALEHMEFLAQHDRLAALQHPNCPEGMFYEIAREYPREAIESVSFLLHQMSDPERASRLIANANRL